MKEKQMTQPAKDDFGRLTYMLMVGTLAFALATMVLMGPQVMAKGGSASWRDMKYLLPEQGRGNAEHEITLPDDSIPSILPVSMENAWVSSEFGLRKKHPVSGRKNVEHSGIDLAVWLGTPVKATAEGVVTHAGRKGGYGLLVEIDHLNGMVTRYAHNDSIKVKKGQYLTRGTVVALSGNSGTSTGAHLHYEVRISGEAVDPRPYLPGLGE